MEIESKREGSALTSAEFNQIPDELENVISKAGLTPTKSSLTQVSQSISQMVGDASFYATSGTANDIILSAISPRLAPAKLTNGMMVRFQALYENTDVTSVNVGNLGAKTITIDGTPIEAGKLVGGKIYILTYVSSSDSFELFESGGGSGGLEIGDIGIAPLGIDENQNKRRYLNGQLIMQVRFESFTAKLRKAIELHPTLGCTEEQWQATALLTVSGQVGKFVIDDEQGTIRLPKIIMPIQGLTDLSKLAEIVEAGLPNHTHSYTFQACEDHSGTGRITIGNNLAMDDQTLVTNGVYNNPIYGNSNTVQQEQIQYPYFIQVATGTEESVDVARDIVLNNPFFFGMYQWFEVEPNNASWLRSSDEFHEKKIYTDYYDWLLRIYNGTETQEGVSVKLHTEAYTDYDWVINREEETFRLPLKVKQAFFYAQNIPVVGNGMTLGFTNGTDNYGFGTHATVSAVVNASIYGTNVGTEHTGANIVVNQSLGVTSDATKSGIEAQLGNAERTDLKLYFYVGVVNQDAPLINSGRALEILPKKLDKSQLYNKMTNCITEIPQRIKLELNNGTLTLKAGSEVIVPNGFEADGTTPKFDYVTVQSDYNYDGSTAIGNEQIMMVYSTELEATPSSRVTTCYSGATDPQPTQSGAFWYDTANNVVKRWENSQWNTLGYSLSIAVATNGTGTGGSFISLDQVFNGMGYIGSTIWVDKGVKGLIPNGRNEDGSLRNIEYTVEHLAMRTAQSSTPATFVLQLLHPSDKNSHYKIALTSSSNVFNGKVDIQYNQVSYISETNTIIAGEGTVDSASIYERKCFYLGIGYFQDGKWTGLTPKQPVNLATKDMVDGQWVSIAHKLISAQTAVSNAKPIVFDLSNILPNDGYDYECIFDIIAKTGTTSGNSLEIMVTTDYMFGGYRVCTAVTRTNSHASSGGSFIAIVGQQRSIQFAEAHSSLTSYIILCRFQCYRRIGTNL